MRWSARHCDDRRGWTRSLVNDRFALKCRPPTAHQRGDDPFGAATATAAVGRSPSIGFERERLDRRCMRCRLSCPSRSGHSRPKPYWGDQSICGVAEETARTRKAGVRAVEKSIWCDLLIANPGAAGACGRSGSRPCGDNGPCVHGGDRVPRALVACRIRPATRSTGARRSTARIDLRRLDRRSRLQRSLRNPARAFPWGR